MLFDFLKMAGNYEERKVARYQEGNLTVSTCRVCDSKFAFETVVAHSAYKEGNFIVVENYNTVEEAEGGHERWVKRMTRGTLPESLTEVGGNKLLELLNRCTGHQEQLVFQRIIEGK